MAKAIISISVEAELLVWINEQVKKGRFRNRSHTFEFAVQRLMIFVKTPRLNHFKHASLSRVIRENNNRNIFKVKYTHV